jgi:uncharacterized protein (DUF111 family)
MTTVHLDVVGGIAGDMLIAAMLDALPNMQAKVLGDAIAALPPGVGSPSLIEATSGGLRALRFGLAGRGEIHPDRGAGHSQHDHGDHDHHEEMSGAQSDHGGSAGSFPEMVARIRSVPLSPGAAGHAVAILSILAEAEASIHRIPIDAVQFHEIADWDSLVDVVAAGSIAAALGSACWTVSALPRGGGLTQTRHGLLPVPAPATASILTGFHWLDDGVSGERVTPTGAAILKHLVGQPRQVYAPGRLQAVGTGAGTRSLPGMANVLRALVFAEIDPAAQSRVAVISFEIDDMTGEEIAVAADRLRRVAGVLDLSIGHRRGKKGRSMDAFRLLVRPEAASMAIDRCFSETSTIGLRIREESRVTLSRRNSMTELDGRPVSVKATQRPDGEMTAKAESDDLIGDSLEARRRMKRLTEAGHEE